MKPKRVAAAVPLLALVLLAPARGVAAQETDPQAPSETGEPRWETGLEVQGMAFDNFFQLPASEPQRGVEALRGEGRLTFRPDPARPLEVYGVAGITTYSDDIDGSTLFGGGARWDGAVDDVDLGLRFEQDRPSFEVDTFGTADTVDAALEYSRRLTRDWELTGLGAFQSQDYEQGDGRDNEYLGLGGAVRYRGWGYDFSPELGVEVGERDADDPGEDHDQTDYWLKLRSAPLPPLYLSLRYRFRTRDYSVADPLAGNFGREDERRQIALAADWTLSDLLALTLYYAWEDADSTKATREFTTQLLALGVRLTL